MKEFKKSTHIIKTLPNGDDLTVSVLSLKGERPGPHVFIQSSVHGAELQGNAVIYKLLNYFSKTKFNGEITFVPMANPISINQKAGAYTMGRFNPVTGHNWNRNYVDIAGLPENKTNFNIKEFVNSHIDKTVDEIKSSFKTYLLRCLNHYENSLTPRNLSDNKELNIFLQKLAHRADIVLDLHTGPVACRYLYAAEFEKDDAKNLLFPFTLIIPNEFDGAMDEACFVPWVKLAEGFKTFGNREINFGVNSFTVELGSEERISLAEAKDDAARILNFLQYKGVIEELDQSPAPCQQYWSYLNDYRTYYSPHGGLVDYTKKPGEFFKKDETIAQFLQLSHIENESHLETALYSYCAPCNGVVINHFPSAAVSKGAELMQVIENPNSW